MNKVEWNASEPVMTRMRQQADCDWCRDGPAGEFRRIPVVFGALVTWPVRVKLSGARARSIGRKRPASPAIPKARAGGLARRGQTGLFRRGFGTVVSRRAAKLARHSLFDRRE